MYHGKNTSSGGFSASPHCQGHPVVVGGILGAGGLADIVAGLEPAGFCYLAHFAGKSQAMPYANLEALRTSILWERGLVSAEYIHKTCCSFRHRH